MNRGGNIEDRMALMDGMSQNAVQTAIPFSLSGEELEQFHQALLHILQDSHQSNLRLENSRKAMIHIMRDLKETTEEVQRREQELREKQEQLVQAGKLATLGELTTGVAHELNNPLNNIGLFVG